MNGLELMTLFWQMCTVGTADRADRIKEDMRSCLLCSMLLLVMIASFVLLMEPVGVKRVGQASSLHRFYDVVTEST